jgi:glycosyltransferase involved in cell wall biosynthesis
MSKVLIVHPHFERLGGIETYLLKVCPHLATPHVFCPIAKRAGEHGLVPRLARILRDYRRYWLMLGDADVRIVHLNPSLERKSFFREAVFLLLARLRGKRTLVFFHGWKPGFERWLDRLHGSVFRLLYGADVYVVLADAFAAALQRWGVARPIQCETTVIDDDAIAGFDLDAAVDDRWQTPTRRLVLASRLMRSKGVGVAIEALAVIQRARSGFELVIAGDGDFAGEARALAERLGVEAVSFLGAVPPARVYEELRRAHVLCFPTEHDEGCPNIIVEAMAFGVPAVTRPVGGIPDIFRSGVHGYLTPSTAPEEFARLVLDLVDDAARYRTMARAAQEHAQRHFLASQAAARLDAIDRTLLEPRRLPSEAHST